MVVGDINTHFNLFGYEFNNNVSPTVKISLFGSFLITSDLVFHREILMVRLPPVPAE